MAIAGIKSGALWRRQALARRAVRVSTSESLVEYDVLNPRVEYDNDRDVKFLELPYVSINKHPLSPVSSLRSSKTKEGKKLYVKRVVSSINGCRRESDITSIWTVWRTRIVVWNRTDRFFS